LFTLAINAGLNHIVTGAWGCGVFRNDPEQIAKVLFENGKEFKGDIHFVFMDPWVLKRIFEKTYEQLVVTKDGTN